ncbi:MAG: HAD family phosphatase [Prevotella sp.]|nr:HAD family phosphatase [Prevotella sp.]
MKISTIIFDMGGVVVELTPETAIKRFQEIGLKDARKRLDKYHQTGIFGDLEEGKITPEIFREELGKLTGKEHTYEECCYAWQGYASEVPKCNLDTLVSLRNQGYRLILLSNTNPYMMEWAMSDRFDGNGHPISHYFDSIYLSYQHHMMKPDAMFFRKVLAQENLVSGEVLFIDDGPRNVAAASQLGMHTFCPMEGADWTKEIIRMLS